MRDKVAASRKKGKWTGGSVPLGYDSKDKKLIVNPVEAKTVQLIFTRYLALKSFQKLIDELNTKGIVTKKRKITRKIAGGVPFTYGSLAYFLKNRTYLGETGHGGDWFPGEHEPIIDRDTFDGVQHLLKSNSAGRTGRRQQTGALLAGLIYDDRGNRMSPNFSTKNGVRHRYYISSALLRGRKAKAGSVTRIPAREVEAAILLELRQRPDSDADLESHERINQYVERVIVREKQLAMTLKADESIPITIEWAASKKRDYVGIEGDRRAETSRANSLVQAITRAHAWLKLLGNGTYDSVESLAHAVDLHPKMIRNTIRLAFLPPSTTASILRGESRREVNDLAKSTRLLWS